MTSRKFAPAALAVTLSLLTGSGIVSAQNPSPQPQKMSADGLTGKLFSEQGIGETETPYGTVQDFTSLMSSDKKFASGLYVAGPSRIEITEPYGVDEFMYFLEGGVTLTSSDGTVTEIRAGDALTVPKEWTGVWETEGYRKIWVIYSADGSGLE